MGPMRRVLHLFIALATACSESAPLDTPPNPTAADATAPDAAPADDDAAVGEPDAGPTAERDAEPSDADAEDADATAPPDAGSRTSTTPPPLPAYSDGACPRLVGGRTSSTSVITGFTSRGVPRQFRLLVPRAYDGTRPFPVMFAWHWLNASSASFVRDGELETAVEQMEFITVLPDKKLRPDGNKQYVFDWPFAEPTGQGIEEELVFFDDMLACVGQQYNVDLRRIYGIGVSAGALWVTHLSTTSRVQHFAAIESLSGGLGEVAGAWRMNYTPQPNKFPTLVLWGGANDWLGLSFDRASRRYQDALLADGHFVLSCVHDAGHAMPPIMGPAGQTRFYALWRFMLDHPYGLAPGDSPYATSGVPPEMPSWCTIARP